MGEPPEHGRQGRGTPTDPGWYEVSPECTTEEFTSVARAYARAVVAAHDLEVDVGALSWEVSRRAKRRAGAVRHVDGTPRSVSLTWEHFESRGWHATAATIRHELIHVHLLNAEGDPGHGPDFRRLAEALDSPVHCERFAEPTWWVVCEECGERLARYRRSTLTEHPERYRCRACGGGLRVEANNPD